MSGHNANSEFNTDFKFRRHASARHYPNRRDMRNQIAKGHAVADELDLLVSITNTLNQAKHSVTKNLRKTLRRLERKLRIM